MQQSEKRRLPKGSFEPVPPADQRLAEGLEIGPRTVSEAVGEELRARRRDRTNVCPLLTARNVH
jgi:hypothetical protein